ncbi:Bud site selection protein 6 [Podila epicladia]|nr:Bud site selection protein 6 [Podila epicladia]KAG0085441.1 Bud site selection protein 6 [Podila epicladia]
MDPSDSAPTNSTSTSSGSGSGRRRKTESSAMNPIEATVTKLLVATKQLLEGLTLWSQQRMTEDQVSDIFVQLATQFNLASQSFHEVGIDTSELAHIPDDLRNCLETALGEEPSPTSLDQYLPKIKEVIINLLQGLRQKQNIYREQHDAKTARYQASSPTTSTSPTPSTSRSKSSAAYFRQPSSMRSPELEGIVGGASTARSQSLSAGPQPTFSISTPRDEPLHAETLASLRKSDAITRRASSRRHSQRFSTLLEQNAPTIPRRQAMDPSLLSTYAGYVSSQGSNPGSPNVSLPHNQFPPSISHDQFPPSPSLSTSSLSRSMEGMPLPPIIPVPLPPSGSSPLSGSITSPLLGSSMIPPGPGSDGHSTQSPMLNGSTDTIPALAPMEQSLMEAHSSSSLPLSEPLSVEPIDPSLTLFLQVGKSVKKTRFEGDLTHSSLRMLFMEKFQYNPGQDDFPTIYVKDPQTNIHYELESMADVKQNAFLSLNVDEMENIQRKMDQGFATLSKELHEIKKAQEATEQARQKAVTVSTPSERSPNPESSQMLRSMVQKVLAKNKPAVLSPEISASSQGRFSAADLKPKFEEVQSLRRDLSVVRQLYTELQTETKTMLSSLAGYTSQIRKQALEAPVSSRLFIESGKVKLDKKSEDLTNKIEDLQDVVEDMKLNVTQRRGRPSDISMTFVDKQCEEIGQEIAELSDYIQTLRPSWKKTWEVELQTIVKEQMFLKEQEALLEDLKEDRGSLLQTLGNLRKLLELQLKSSANGLGGLREFHFQPAPVDEGFEGLKTVMEEVKLIAPDSDKRLRAMAQMEKLRHIELSNRIDEFEEELTNFVGESKLRKTGGAQEVERQRQQRDLENLKAMFGKKEGADA